ncbi:SCO4848 family membrane protein [Leucobacter sp. OH1287]|uniref:SCO4848 family membrane protein n=1 Tax=Leucobacter sp. OH1287 TaxID=2491049 RepID=UPI000F5D7D1E|nr:hypothetical protein [Leucobacter sp. OH1287]RRD60371.1 hypothetical protein EII30_06360 [Leucobacter sp. OH1287]
MTILLAVLLLVNAVFNFVIWPPFLRRVRKDQRAYDAEGRATSFLKVHVILIGTAFAIAGASLVGGIAGLLIENQ